MIKTDLEEILDKVRNRTEAEKVRIDKLIKEKEQVWLRSRY